MRYVQRSDVYVAVGAIALVGAAGLVWHGLRENAAATLSVATAIDCSNQLNWNDESYDDDDEQSGFRDLCRLDARVRRKVSGRHY